MFFSKTKNHLPQIKQTTLIIMKKRQKNKDSNNYQLSNIVKKKNFKEKIYN